MTIPKTPEGFIADIKAAGNKGLTVNPERFNGIPDNYYIYRSATAKLKLEDFDQKVTIPAHKLKFEQATDGYGFNQDLSEYLKKSFHIGYMLRMREVATAANKISIYGFMEKSSPSSLRKPRRADSALIPGGELFEAHDLSLIGSDYMTRYLPSLPTGYPDGGDLGYTEDLSTLNVVDDGAKYPMTSVTRPNDFANMLWWSDAFDNPQPGPVTFSVDSTDFRSARSERLPPVVIPDGSDVCYFYTKMGIEVRPRGSGPRPAYAGTPRHWHTHEENRPDKFDPLIAEFSTNNSIITIILATYPERGNDESELTYSIRDFMDYVYTGGRGPFDGASKQWFGLMVTHEDKMGFVQPTNGNYYKGAFFSQSLFKINGNNNIINLFIYGDPRISCLTPGNKVSCLNAFLALNGNSNLVQFTGNAWLNSEDAVKLLARDFNLNKYWAIAATDSSSDTKLRDRNQVVVPNDEVDLKVSWLANNEAGTEKAYELNNFLFGTFDMVRLREYHINKPGGSSSWGDAKVTGHMSKVYYTSSDIERLKRIMKPDFPVDRTLSIHEGILTVDDDARHIRMSYGSWTYHNDFDTVTGLKRMFVIINGKIVYETQERESPYVMGGMGILYKIFLLDRAFDPERDKVTLGFWHANGFLRVVANIRLTQIKPRVYRMGYGSHRSLNENDGNRARQRLLDTIRTIG